MHQSTRLIQGEEKQMKNEKTNTFNSRIGFILASVGSAIGMGNIWMFPYRLGQNGGAAFLIPYFLFVALFGYVGLSGEFALGRLTGTGPVGSYDYAMKSRGKRGERSWEPYRCSDPSASPSDIPSSSVGFSVPFSVQQQMRSIPPAQKHILLRRQEPLAACRGI